MIVRELIKELEKLDQDREVIVSSDAEGNSYHGVYQVDHADYNRVMIGVDDQYLQDEEVYDSEIHCDCCGVEVERGIKNCSRCLELEKEGLVRNEIFKIRIKEIYGD